MNRQICRAASDPPDYVSPARFLFVVGDFHAQRLNAASYDLFAQVLVPWRIHRILANEVADYPNDLLSIDVGEKL